MSCNAWMGCTVTVLESKYDAAAIEWDGRARHPRDAEGHLLVNRDYDCAGYFDRAIERVKEDLSDLRVPVCAWKASVEYEYFDEPFEDGALCTFDVIDGKVANYRESRIKMVEFKPPFELDLAGKEQ